MSPTTSDYTTTALCHYHIETSSRHFFLPMAVPSVPLRFIFLSIVSHSRRLREGIMGDIQDNTEPAGALYDIFGLLSPLYYETLQSLSH